MAAVEFSLWIVLIKGTYQWGEWVLWKLRISNDQLKITRLNNLNRIRFKEYQIYLIKIKNSWNLKLIEDKFLESSPRKTKFFWKLISLWNPSHFSKLHKFHLITMFTLNFLKSQKQFLVSNIIVYSSWLANFSKYLNWITKNPLLVLITTILSFRCLENQQFSQGAATI